VLDINERLNNIETRLHEIELKLGMAKEAAPPPLPLPLPPPPAPRPAAAAAAVAPPPTRTAGAAALSSKGGRASAPPGAGPRESRSKSEEPVSATQLMAWAAGFALLLAAVYFLKLVYDVGWLTPERQLILAALAGLALIAAGLMVARVDREYAAYLPAVGLIVLYLTAYAAHLFYHLWASQPAIAAVSAITVAGIWLGRRFDRSAYAILAAAGVYLSPILMQAAPNRLLDVVIFYTAWSLLFSFCALSEGRRITYMLPMLFALIGFDLVWRTAGDASWLLAVIYQLIQLAVFASTAAAFSIVHKRPLNDIEGAAHGLAMLLFYGLEYLVLRQHAPQWAPVVALLSAVLVLALYLVARMALHGTERIGVGAVIVSGYCSIVVAHAVFFELLPHAWFVWAALAMAVVVAVLFSRPEVRDSAALWPVLIVTALLFCVSYLTLLARGEHGSDVAFPALALALYALMLYGGYYLLSRASGDSRAAPIMLYAAHFAFMEWGLRWVGSGLPLSMVWAVFAVLILILAIRSEDKLLGQSALLIFCAAGLKVLLHDLAASSSLVRVMTLIVLAVSLYVGGWLYQSLVRRIIHPDPAVNRQINAIRGMVEKRMTAQQIALELVARRYPYFGEGPWNSEKVEKIMRDYGLDASTSR